MAAHESAPARSGNSSEGNDSTPTVKKENVMTSISEQQRIRQHRRARSGPPAWAAFYEKRESGTVKYLSSGAEVNYLTFRGDLYCKQLDDEPAMVMIELQHTAGRVLSTFDAPLSPDEARDLARQLIMLADTIDPSDAQIQMAVNR